MTDQRDVQIRENSIAKYRKRAAGYDQTCGPTWPIRMQAINALELQPGDCVLDVGCGTGLSLPLLVQAVGTSGKVFGFDQSPDMLAQAHERCVQADWQNVHLTLSSAQDLVLTEPVDAFLFHYTHDILRSPSAIDHLLSLGKPGARVSIAGIKYFRGVLSLLNPWVYLKNQGYNGAPGELRTPWDRIAPRLTNWQITPTQWGMGYLASGRLPTTASGTAAGTARE